MNVLLKRKHPNYRIQPNYRTHPYKRTVKQFCSLQITASELFVDFFIKAYVVGTHSKEIRKTKSKTITKKKKKKNNKKKTTTTKNKQTNKKKTTKKKQNKKKKKKKKKKNTQIHRISIIR